MIMNWQSAAFPLLPSFGDPKWMPQAPKPGAFGHDAHEDTRKTRIIVIDDEVLIAETVVEILMQEGFDATAASNGTAAIELAKTWKPDMVLSDVIMPGLNGIETGIKIREIVPSCKIILFSGQAATVDLLERAREGGHYFEILAKPIKPEELVSVIRTTAGPR